MANKKFKVEHSTTIQQKTGAIRRDLIEQKLELKNLVDSIIININKLEEQILKHSEPEYISFQKMDCPIKLNIPNDCEFCTHGELSNEDYEIKCQYKNDN